MTHRLRTTALRKVFKLKIIFPLCLVSYVLSYALPYEHPPLTGVVHPHHVTHSRHRDVPATAAQLHLLASHGQVGKPAAGLGTFRALSGQMLRGNLGTQGLQLTLVVDLQGTGRVRLTDALLPSPLAVELFFSWQTLA